MANKRMFSLTVCDSDKFLEMSQSAQLLYFHLGLHGDDDGFIGSPRKITRACGCDASDIKELIDNGFIFQFESGVVAVVDWNVNNTLKNDRYNPTMYQTERAMLSLDDSKRYKRNQNGTRVEPQHNITQQNLTQLQQNGTRTQGNRGLQGGRTPKSRLCTAYP